MNELSFYEVFKTRHKAPPKALLASIHLSLFMAVRTTGIFCRPGCPARLPKPENVCFYESAEAALLAGFRPCKRCHPMHMPGQASALVRRLINLVEADPERRWNEADLAGLGIDPSTARRHFKNRFGLTFSRYARLRRLAQSAAALKKGEKVINAQLSAGYDSPSGFRDAFTKAFGRAPNRGSPPPLYYDWLDTPLGPMVVIADERALYLSEFSDRKNLDGQMARLSKYHNRPLLPGKTDITREAFAQLGTYFSGARQSFDLPLETSGTSFQNKVWQALQSISYGQTRTYSDLAEMIGSEKAVRAVASSNAANAFAIIIPCHRVIAKNGGLGGYAGGLERKNWLLGHERSALTDK